MKFTTYIEVTARVAPAEAGCEAEVIDFSYESKLDTDEVLKEKVMEKYHGGE